MRYTVLIVPTFLLVCVSLLGWRVQRLSSRDLAVLTGQMDSLASDWEAKKVPLSSRVVTILLSDASAAADPFLLAPEEDEGVLETAGSWINRNLIGASSRVLMPTELGRAFANSTALVVWTHQGYSAVSEEAISRELEKALLKAHDAGAEINIVAQGVDAAAVLTALKRLEGVKRGGVAVGANRVLLLGMDAPRLKLIPSIAAYDFSKSGNVLELASVWVPRDAYVRTVKMQAFNGKRGGEIITMEQVWPGIVEGNDAVERNLRLLRKCIEGSETLDQVISRQEAALREEQARKADAEAVATAAQKRLGDQQAAQETAHKEMQARQAGVEAARRAQATAIQWVTISGGTFMTGDAPEDRVTVRYRFCPAAGRNSCGGSRPKTSRISLSTGFSPERS